VYIFLFLIISLEMGITCTKRGPVIGQCSKWNAKSVCSTLTEYTITFLAWTVFKDKSQISNWLDCNEGRLCTELKEDGQLVGACEFQTSEFILFVII
jgi:hypothetical protein